MSEGICMCSGGLAAGDGIKYTFYPAPCGSRMLSHFRETKGQWVC